MGPTVKFTILDYRDKVHFDEILERVGWVADHPSMEEERLGWTDFATFRTWLRGFLEGMSPVACHPEKDGSL